MALTVPPHPQLGGMGTGAGLPLSISPQPEESGLRGEVQSRPGGSKVSRRERRWVAKQAATHLAGPIIEVCSPGQGHKGRDG